MRETIDKKEYEVDNLCLLRTKRCIRPGTAVAVGKGHTPRKRVVSIQDYFPNPKSANQEIEQVWDEWKTCRDLEADRDSGCGSIRKVNGLSNMTSKVIDAKDETV